jgi:hypothetical protein
MSSSLKCRIEVSGFMRERRNLEKRQLPETTFEVWLNLQRPTIPTSRHRAPAQDVYEAWVKKRVEQVVRRMAI